MSDKALENAEALKNQLLQRKKELMNEILQIEDQLAKADRFITAWYDFAGVERPKPVENSTAKSDTKEERVHSAPARRPKNSDKVEVANVAREIIQERGEPVSRSDLYAELIKRGLTIEGKDPEMVLSTMLWRMRDRIVRLPSGGYWLKEQNWPPAGYQVDIFGPLPAPTTSQH